MLTVEELFGVKASVSLLLLFLFLLSALPELLDGISASRAIIRSTDLVIGLFRNTSYFINYL